MVADKTGASVVPVRIDGLERAPLSRMKDTQVRRKLFPKVVVTIGKPQTISVDPELRGARRRSAAGAALYEVMAGTVLKSASTDRTVAKAVVDAAKKFGMSTNARRTRRPGECPTASFCSPPRSLPASSTRCSANRSM
jgi:acyl-[acyl-carrier-protein]-phospholipid O-acyltransferase/long-chain-fatty-acid--[acyl-carrier-protein] ligase